MALEGFSVWTAFQEAAADLRGLDCGFFCVNGGRLTLIKIKRTGFSWESVCV